MAVVSKLVPTALRLLSGLLLALAVFAPALADEAGDRAKLDRLFAALKTAPDEGAADAISRRIWVYWTTPADPELAERIGEVFAARHIADHDEALLLLDRLVEDYPHYSEGWNQRATLHYLLRDFESSLADCARVLELEPRHFGALSGRALIYLQQGKRGLALRDMAAALALHPYLKGRQLFPELQQHMTRI